MLHCAVCFHNRDEFYRQAYAAVLSCFLNTREALHLHMVVDDSVTPHLPLFQDLCERHGHLLTVHAPPAIPDDVRGLFRELDRYTDASLYRLCLHEMIDADRLIYFDCDIVFERDVADLAAVDVSRAWAAAAHDPERRWRRRKYRYYIRRLRIDADRYFNSGVLLLNLNNLRQASAEAGGNVFWQEYRRLGPLMRTLPYDIFDQDMLNILLSPDRERLILLDPSFNYEVCLFDRRFLPLDQLQGKILHFAALKPWMKFFPAHLAYWKYDALTPWGNTTFERVSQRLHDPRDRWMNLVFDVWRRPGRYRWIRALLRPLDRLLP